MHELTHVINTLLNPKTTARVNGMYLRRTYTENLNNIIDNKLYNYENIEETIPFISNKRYKKAKKEIGYMPEGVPLYTDLTVKEFVNYMADIKKVDKKQKKEKIEKILKETGLEDVKGKLIKNLSRGYKQRVSMAGALVGNPDVLILDEPTVGLDPKQILEIRNLIKELGKNHTVILSSHILSEVSQVCEKVVIINKGKILAVDTPENLEEKTRKQNVLFITVEDKENRIEEIKQELKDIKELTLVKDNEDGTKQYRIVTDENIDLRKDLFDVLPKKEITIFELKKDEASLEDAFMKLITSDEEAKEENENDAKKEKEKSNENKKKSKSKQESVKDTENKEKGGEK